MFEPYIPPGESDVRQYQSGLMKVSVLRLWLSLSVLVSAAMPVLAQQQVVWSGMVVDSATGAGISGAAIRVEGSTKGTYARSGGTFRLPLPSGTYTLRVRSLGYGERMVTVTPATTTLNIALQPTGVTTATVDVTGEITPEEVIKRAIQRKKENAARVNTIISTLYSKLRFEMEGSGLLTKIGGGDEEMDRAAITETFSKIYEQRKPTEAKHIRILNRRQTKNVAASANTEVFDEFFDFTADEFRILNTRLVTPLATDALGEYRYTMVGKKTLGNQMVYEIAFEPRARIFPGFEGTLVIVDKTWHVIEARFAPTKETAFPFLKDLRFEQRYEKVNDSIWAPTYQQLSARLTIDVVKGLMEFEAKALAQTYVTEVAVNEAIPDSILRPDSAKRIQVSFGTPNQRRSDSIIVRGSTYITVDKGADTSGSAFWEQHAFAEQSPEETAIYRHADSLHQADSTGERASRRRRNDSSAATMNLGQVGDVGFNFTPIINYSQITGLMIGGQSEISWKGFKLVPMAAFGREDTRVGAVGLTWRTPISRKWSLDLAFGVGSRLATVQQAHDILKQFKTFNIGNLLYPRYYDFYRRDGTDAAIVLADDRTSFSLMGSWNRHILMPVIEGMDRPNVLATPGDYRTLFATIEVGEPTFMDNFLGTGWPVHGSVNAGVGEATATKEVFWSIETNVNVHVPTFATGYYPMELSLGVIGGMQTTNTPIQYQFNLMRRFPVFGRTTDFSTVPVNAYGGTEYVGAHAEHNFSDMWWRIVGLPTYNGRGLDLIGIVGAVSMTQRAAPWVAGEIYDSTPGIYTEAGFAVSRIPTFISDLFYLRFDAMWPCGPVATRRGTFGWMITLSSPLL